MVIAQETVEQWHPEVKRVLLFVSISRFCCQSHLPFSKQQMPGKKMLQFERAYSTVQKASLHFAAAITVGNTF